MRFVLMCFLFLAMALMLPACEKESYICSCTAAGKDFPAEEIDLNYQTKQQATVTCQTEDNLRKQIGGGSCTFKVIEE